MNVRDDITNGAREEVESLWVELQREETKVKIILGVCYRPPNQREEGEGDLHDSLEWRRGWEVSICSGILIIQP